VNKPGLNGSSCFPPNPEIILKGSPGELEYTVRTCLPNLEMTRGVAKEVEEVPDPVRRI
jgi:hypothetical protein